MSVSPRLPPWPKPSVSPFVNPAPNPIPVLRPAPAITRKILCQRCLSKLY